MNILVRTYGGNTVFRPDTTWERHGRDFYVPESVTALEWSPVVFVRISRAGRSISEKFASRYFDAVGEGVLLYSRIEGAEGYAAGSCLNNSSYLPDASLKAPEEFGAETLELVRKAVADCSSVCQLRLGDLVAAETSPRREVEGKENFNFEIIY